MRWPEGERSEKCGGTGRDGTRMRKHGLRIHRKARKIFSDEILLNNVNDARVIGLLLNLSFRRPKLEISVAINEQHAKTTAKN